MTPRDDGLEARTVEARARTVSPEEAAERLGLKASTLANLRWSGQGPTYIKCGGRVRYRLVDLADYLDAQARHSTSVGNGRSDGHGRLNEKE